MKPITIEEVRSRVVKAGFKSLISTEVTSNKDIVKVACECGEEIDILVSSIGNTSSPSCSKCRSDLKLRDSLKNKHGNKFIPLEKLSGTNKEHKFKHVDCGAIFIVKVKNLLASGKCPVCEMRKTTTTETFKRSLFEKRGDEFSLVGEFNMRKCLFRHNKCGHYWESRPYNILKGFTSCPNCKGGVKKYHIDFVKDVVNAYGYEYSVLGTYISTHVKIKIRHNECMHEWEVTPAHLLSGTGCPKCRSMSKGEAEINNYLLELGLNFKTQYRIEGLKFKKHLRFDFAVFEEESLKYLIEYQGEQHYKPVRFSKSQSDSDVKNALHSQIIKDNIKRDYCQSHNIPLLEVKYLDKGNVEEIINNFKI